MEPIITMTIGGLTKLDQIELKKALAPHSVTFRQEQAPEGELGYVPGLEMIAQVAPAVIATISTAVAIWIAKDRASDAHEITMSMKKADGTEISVAMKSKKTMSKSEGAAEFIKLAKTLTDQAEGRR